MVQLILLSPYIVQYLCSMVRTMDRNGQWLNRKRETLRLALGIQRLHALCKTWKPYSSHKYLIPLLAECVPLDVALMFRFIHIYRTVALSDNMIVN